MNAYDITFVTDTNLGRIDGPCRVISDLSHTATDEERIAALTDALKVQHNIDWDIEILEIEPVLTEDMINRLIAMAVAYLVVLLASHVAGRYLFKVCARRWPATFITKDRMGPVIKKGPLGLWKIHQVLPVREG
jgi:hypothetical protein